jgi:hypothetical protein
MTVNGMLLVVTAGDLGMLLLVSFNNDGFPFVLSTPLVDTALVVVGMVADLVGVEELRWVVLMDDDLLLLFCRRVMALGGQSAWWLSADDEI